MKSLFGAQEVFEVMQNGYEEFDVVPKNTQRKPLNIQIKRVAKLFLHSIKYGLSSFWEHFKGDKIKEGMRHLREVL